MFWAGFRISQLHRGSFICPRWRIKKYPSGPSGKTEHTRPEKLEKVRKSISMKSKTSYKGVGRQLL